MSATKSVAPLLALLLCLLSSQARAQEIAVANDRVTLATLLPALDNTELGSLDIAAAPTPGETIVVRASDVRAKLKAAGKDDRGLAIPKSVRIVRHARRLEAGELDEKVKVALAPLVAPCDIDQLSSLPSLSIAEGEFELEAEPLVRKASGRTNVSIKLTQGGRLQRISAQAVLTCPEPVIMPGAQIRLVVNAGSVHVSAPGVAAQPGRVGDEIRVTNQITKKSLRGRVLDAQSVEVMP